MQEAEVERQVRALKDNLESYFKDNPISINVESGIAQDGKAAEGSWKEAAKAVQSVGSAIQQIENPAAKVAGIVAQSIATVALAYADTLAKDSGSKSNIFAFIAAAAAATISMATTIASIHSTTGYEKGGIIKGNSYSGDRIAGMASGELIGLDAGELVLTRAMQGSLAAQLNDGARGGGISSTPYVTGEKIVLGINNYARRHGMGELVFSHG